MSLRRVNRAALDGTNVSILVSIYRLKCSKFSYGDSLTISKGSRLGSQEQDYQTSGSYKADDPAFTVEAVDYREFLDLLAVNGFGNRVVPAIVLYEHPDMGRVSDLLDGTRFLTGAISGESGEKMLEHEIKCSTMQVYWGDQRKTLNYITGKPRARGTIF
jgi:hypothetical protein